MATFPVGQGYTPTQWEAWFAANSSAVSKFTGTGPLNGKTWSQVYAYLWTEDSGKGTPDQVASAVADLEGLEALGVGAADAASDAGTAADASETGIETASILPSWTSGLTTLLSDLTSHTVWVRILKIVVGGVMLLEGLMRASGAQKTIIGTIAKGAV